MSESVSQASYVRRFTRVIEYIYAHLDEAPDLNRLAEVAPSELLTDICLPLK